MSNKEINVQNIICNNNDDNQNIINTENDNRKGRKNDGIRKLFIKQNNRLKCTFPKCEKSFSTNSSVTVLKYHMYNDHEKSSNIKTKNVNIVDNMKNNENSENDAYKAFAIAFAKNSLPYSFH